MAEIRGRKQINRTVLHEVVPLDVPFVLGIYLGDVCNFKCKYCVQSADVNSEAGKDLIRYFLDWDLFERIVDQALEFKLKIKTVMLSSIGEPLLHPNVCKMIKYMNDKNLADNYEIVSNASMLTKEMAHNLIDSGLTRLCVSVQGITTKKYKDICGYEMNIQELRDNLEEFYNYGRGRCKLHIKTVDAALDEGEEKDFFDMFSPICDTIFVDKVMPVFQGVEYDNIMLAKDEFTDDIFKRNAKICCSPIFYTLYVRPDGTIAPCCDSPQPITYGNVKTTTLVDAWNGLARLSFLMQHLRHMRSNNKVCAKCYVPIVRRFEEDFLDGYEDEIAERLMNKFQF